MIDEFDKKAAADETNDQAQVSPDSGVNLVDLVRNDLSNKIKPESPAQSLPSEHGAEGVRIKDQLRDLLNPAFEQPLSRTEQLLLRGMNEAIRSGSLKDAQDMLVTLAENPASVDRVMRAMQEQMKHPEYMSWEQGADSRGQSFVRLHLAQRNDDTKSSGRTEVTIGSDGRNSASYTERWNSPQKQLNPENAIRNFAHKKLDNFKELDDLQYRPLHFDHYNEARRNRT